MSNPHPSEIGQKLGLNSDEIDIVQRLVDKRPGQMTATEVALATVYGAHTQREMAEAYDKAARKQQTLTGALIFFTAVQAVAVAVQVFGG